MINRTWIYEDQDGQHKVTDAEIIRDFYPAWREMMRKKNSSFSESVLTHENCIRDFIAVHWAWRVRNL